MIDLVADFGIDILPDKIKTPKLLHIIHSHRDKIHAVNEIRTRQQTGRLTENRVYDLMYAATGDSLEAEKAQSYFILEETRKPK